jgi:hypothetical protein
MADLDPAKALFAEFAAWEKQHASAPISIPPRRGWHGMKARNQRKYKPEDWRVWGQIGGTAVLVDVSTGSPAWRSGINTGTWIFLIDEKAFELFEQSGAPVGNVINVRAFRPDVGHINQNLILSDPPKGGRPRSNPSPAVPCGERVAKRDRPRWLMKVSEAPKIGAAAIAVATRLAMKHARGNGEAWPGIQTLARDLGISENTVKRALNRLHLAGFINIRSGRKAGRVNVYTLTWPAPIETNVLRLRP